MLQFLKTVLATLVGLILFTILGAGGLALLVYSATQSDPITSSVRKKQVLVYDLSLAIRDNNPSSPSLSSPFSSGPGGNSLRSVVKSLEAAAEDEKIVAIYIQGANYLPAGGFGTLKEVREALKTFRKAGKPIYAYDSKWSETEYYLASVANTMTMDPIGTLTLDGFSSEVRFYAGALEKYGLGMQVVRVGKFKSAVEPYLNQEFSQDNRQQTENLLQSLWSNFLVTLGEYRPVQTEEFQAIANQKGLLTSDEALEQKLIDRISYPDEIAAELKEMTGGPEDEPFRQISLSEYIEVAKEMRRGNNRSDNRIAVVYVEGDIISGKGALGVAGSDSIAQLLRETRLDEEVKAVVLRINSPGGGATAASVIGREVELLAETKPLVASMGDFAASGGYWIAAPAEKIFALPGTLTGSIGTYGLLPNVQKIANQHGITWDAVTTAPFANSNTISRPKTPEELAINQKTADAIYDEFLEIVAKGRALPREAVENVAQGRIWSGLSAKSLGLVDELGGLEMAIAEAAQLAGLEAEDWSVEQYPRQRGFLEEAFFDEFLSRMTPWQSSDPSHTIRDNLPTPIAQEWEHLQTDLEGLRYLNDPNHVYTRLPFNLNIE